MRTASSPPAIRVRVAEPHPAVILLYFKELVRAYRQCATSHPGEETAARPALAGCMASLLLLSLRLPDATVASDLAVQLRACGMASLDAIAC